MVHRAILDQGPGTCPSVGRPRAGADLRHGASPAPQHVDGSSDQRHRDGVIEVVEVVSYGLPVLAECVPEVGQGEYPGYATEDGVDGELGEVHSGRAGGEGDEGTDHGEAAGDEYGELSVAVEPFLGYSEVVRPHTEVFTVAEPDFASAPEADRICYPGAHEVAENAGGYCCGEAHLAFGDQVAGERGDGFGGDQNSHALQQHEHEARGDTVAADGRRDEVYERVQDR